MRKILSKSDSSPSYLQTNDKEWTESSLETNNLLVETHFPGCSEVNEPIGENHCEHNLDHNIFTIDKVRWAINTFDPFKSTGMDGIIPRMLQMTANKIAP